ncbi:hypothetical protein LSM04_003815 [Trypanosoma melophagium]|uniref:uncharacterized protein n=1 Tax=Trypanosoma melophagium TaxID=715481 RepID=UPI003519EBD3|nr:hypothetical protein LSM04_003815 [Trypanosoma melophagium]
MEFDADIIPLMQGMDAAHRRMQTELLPLLTALDEDVVVSKYGVDEQARISIAAAYALVLLTYAHDRLWNKVGSEKIDPQVKLKMERVSEYIKKLHEITLLDSKEQQQQQKQEKQEEKEENDNDNRDGKKRGRMKKENVNKTDEGNSRKRMREEKSEAAASQLDETNNTNANNTTTDPYGDTLLFKEIVRNKGRTAELVQNLIGHTMSANKA